MNVTAKTSFYFEKEMWLKGETKNVNATHAHELKQAGLVDDAKGGETEGAKAPDVQLSFAEQHEREMKPAKPKLEKK